MGAETKKRSEMKNSKKDKSTVKVVWKIVMKILERNRWNSMIGCRRMTVMSVL